MTANTFRTREEWLLAGRDALQREFFGEGRQLPKKLACSCGWPKGGGKRIGECWSVEASEDGTSNIFICPTQADPVRVLDILLHELGHAFLGNEVKHTAPFAKLMREFGLAGKPTATIAEPGSETYAKLKAIADDLGPYPHAAMKKPEKKNAKKVQWVRIVSVSNSDYKLSFAMNPSVEEHGFPIDPWGETMVEEGGE